MGITIIPTEFGQAVGYDLRVAAGECTVGDYEVAVETAIERDNFSRLWKKTNVCRGCHLCCMGRIPLTAVDALRLAGGTLKRTGRKVPQPVPSSGSLVSFLRKYCTVSVVGPSIDISLKLKDNGLCCFLDEKERTCRVYPQRPLACRTFVCSPLSERARRLRETIINRGEDELVRLLLSAKEQGQEWVDEADEPAVDPADWEENAFTGKTDHFQVALEEVVPAGLWGRLHAV